MRVLGVDPGLARTGVAIVDGASGHLVLLHATCIETVPQPSEAGRLAMLFDLVVEACTTLRPEVAAVEELFFSTNRRTAMRVSEARGVVLCALAREGIPVAEYTPTQVKEAVCGYGAARKPQVARMVANLLGVPDIPGHDDVADACAVAVCHHHRGSLGALAPRTRDHRESALDIAVRRARAAMLRSTP
jgi:crossover junction endodeoxyribonuclease RuvC